MCCGVSCIYGRSESQVKPDVRVRGKGSLNQKNVGSVHSQNLLRISSTSAASVSWLCPSYPVMFVKP